MARKPVALCVPFEERAVARGAPYFLVWDDEAKLWFLPATATTAARRRATHRWPSFSRVSDSAFRAAMREIDESVLAPGEDYTDLWKKFVDCVPRDFDFWRRLTVNTSGRLAEFRFRVEWKRFFEAETEPCDNSSEATVVAAPPPPPPPLTAALCDEDAWFCVC
jgi:hypothetical protein